MGSNSPNAPNALLPGFSDSATLVDSLLAVSRPSPGTTSSVWRTYPYFVGYFKRARPIGAEHFVIGASFVYSWMPTMLELRHENHRVAAAVLEAARTNRCIEEFELTTLATTINNSVVGASKLLHFVAPNAFPIWDSRVATFLGAKVAPAERGVDQYLEYQRQMVRLARDKRLRPLVDDVRRVAKQNVSAIRAIEYVMYLGGGRSQIQ